MVKQLFFCLLLLALLSVSASCPATAPPGQVPWLGMGVPLPFADNLTNGPMIAMNSAWWCAGLPGCNWSDMDKGHGVYDFSNLDAFLAWWKPMGRKFILKINDPPPADVTETHYLSRLGALIRHMAHRFPTADTGLWVALDNEPAWTPAGFDRHAAILARCFSRARGRLKIVGFMQIDCRPSAFKAMVDRGCANNCDAADVHMYANWYISPDLPYNPPDISWGPHGPLYDELMACKALLPPGMPLFCDEMGFSKEFPDRNLKAVLLMLCAHVEMIQPHLYHASDNLVGDATGATNSPTLDSHKFYGCWHVASDAPAPWGQCLADIARQSMKWPAGYPTLTRSPNGDHVVIFPNGVTYRWNALTGSPIEVVEP